MKASVTEVGSREGPWMKLLRSLYISQHCPLNVLAISRGYHLQFQSCGPTRCPRALTFTIHRVHMFPSYSLTQPLAYCGALSVPIGWRCGQRHTEFAVSSVVPANSPPAWRSNTSVSLYDLLPERGETYQRLSDRNYRTPKQHPRAFQVYLSIDRN